MSLCTVSVTTPLEQRRPGKDETMSQSETVAGDTCLPVREVAR